MFRRILLIVSSALLLHGALWNSQYLFWCSFFWLLPLFYSVLRSRRCPSFAQGFLWGLVFFSLHAHPVIRLFFYQAHEIGRFVVPIFLICYGAAHTGAWFWLAGTTAVLAGDNVMARVLSWVFWTYCFIIWVPVGILWISGEYMGYPFFFPLLPLAQYPQFLWFLGTIGRHALVLSLICFSMCVSLFFVTRNGWCAALSTVWLAPFFIGFLALKPEEKVPAFFKKIGYVRPPDSEEFNHPMDVAQEIYYRMRRLLEKHPELTHIMMPELSFRFPLNEHKHVITMWNNNVLRDEVQLLIGACRSEGERIFNSLYWIKEGRVEQCYDKSRLMPLVEYVPHWCNAISFIPAAFLDKNEFSATPCNGQVFALNKEVMMEPCICAELFFGKPSVSGRASDNGPLLSILNDSVLSHPFPSLMLLWNNFRALEQIQPHLYVGYKKGFWITPNGTILRLSQLNA